MANTEIAQQNQFAPDLNVQAREQFLKRFDTNPSKVDKAQGYDTVPISTLEVTLDEVYLGLWETTNFKHQVIANEIVGSLELRVFDPSARVWITRVGCASVMIRQTKDASITDIGAKIKNGLVMDFPKLSTMCLKAAAKTLGKCFGRNLNRKWEDTYEEIYTNELDLQEVIGDLTKRLSVCNTPKDLLEVWNDCEALHNNPQAKKVFNSYKMKLNLNGNK